MTPAVAPPLSPPSSHQPRAVPLVILGTDALLAAAPATPVQLAHACLKAGFANVLPASWGDELIATAALRRLPELTGSPVIQCSCPIVAHRLLNVGGDLRPAMLAFVAPPVAVARYVRRLAGATPTRITYVGACPGANDASIDIRMSPAALLALLADREITLDDQPRVFESVLPPDRRRFRSQPGGVPAVDALWSEAGSRTYVEVGTDDLVTELAQQLLTGRNVLIDAAPSLGCVCCGAVEGADPREARNAVSALEPPRAAMAVIDEAVPIDLELQVPASPRTPIDVGAVVVHGAHGKPAPAPAQTAHLRQSPTRPITAIPESKPAGRPSGPVALRSVLGAAPVTRGGEGKSLPRAYVARRRQSPRHLPVVPSSSDQQSAEAPPAASGTRGRKAIAIAQAVIDAESPAGSTEPTAEPRASDANRSPSPASPAVPSPALLTTKITEEISASVGTRRAPDSDALPASSVSPVIEHSSVALQSSPAIAAPYEIPAPASIASPARERQTSGPTRPIDEPRASAGSRHPNSSRPRPPSRPTESRAANADGSTRKIAIIVGAIALWAAMSVGTGVVVARFLRPSLSASATGAGR